MTNAVKLACLVATVSTSTLGGKALAAQRTLEILPGAPGPETALIIDGPIKDIDVYTLVAQWKARTRPLPVAAVPWPWDCCFGPWRPMRLVPKTST